jgi:hypothetical protein
MKISLFNFFFSSIFENSLSSCCDVKNQTALNNCKLKDTTHAIEKENLNPLS